jgi:hypothetical protein
MRLDQPVEEAKLCDEFEANPDVVDVQVVAVAHEIVALIKIVIALGRSAD